MAFDLQPILTGTLLELRPLRTEDFDALYTAAKDPLIWEQHPDRERYQEERFRVVFQGGMESGGALIAIDRKDGAVVGFTRYHNYHPELSEIEIGWTFLARSHWGGRYNGEMKDLMLRHAFTFLDRVVFSVGVNNRRSRRAVEKLGGLLVGERLDGPGRLSVVYHLTAATYAGYAP